MAHEIPNADDLQLAVDRITHSVVAVSAETAKRWLQHNKRNRVASPLIVARYRTDMERGLWQFAGDPIRFDVNGHLSDGQHRLMALSETDLTLPMLVVRGLPVDSQLVMDQGRKRTPGQQLELHGVKNASNVAAAVKVLMQWEQGLLFRDSKLSGGITAAKITAYVNDNQGDIDAFHAVASMLRSFDVPPSVSGAFFITAFRVAPNDAVSFVQQLASMTGMSEGNPIHTLDRRLRRIRREGIKTTPRDYLAFLILAWNAWRDGKRMSKFQRPQGGSWTAETFPSLR